MRFAPQVPREYVPTCVNGLPELEAAGWEGDKRTSWVIRGRAWSQFLHGTAGQPSFHKWHYQSGRLVCALSLVIREASGGTPKCYQFTWPGSREGRVAPGSACVSRLEASPDFHSSKIQPRRPTTTWPMPHVRVVALATKSLPSAWRMLSILLIFSRNFLYHQVWKSSPLEDVRANSVPTRHWQRRCVCSGPRATKAHR